MKTPVLNSAITYKICSTFGIGERLRVSKVEGGVLNHNYLLETTLGKYFVKGVREKVKERLPGIYATENYMRAEGIPAIVMQKTVEGKLFLETSGNDVYTVYPFIESVKDGRSVLRDHRAMGALLGKIHTKGELPEKGTINPRELRRQEKSLQIAKINEYKERVEKMKEKQGIDEKFLEYMNLKLELVKNQERPDLEYTTLTHGDYHAGNMLFDPETLKIIGICDWEKSEWAPRSFEVARSLLYVCFNGQFDFSEALEQTRNFLAGYRSEHTLEREELKQGFDLRYYTMLCSFWLEDKHYVAGDTRADHFVDHEIAIITLLTDENKRAAILAYL